MHLLNQRDTFIFDCDYKNRHIPKKAGFWWDGTNKHWYTKDPTIASALIEYADSDVRNLLIKKKTSKKLTYKDNKFIWSGGYSTRHIPKQAGFRWDGANKHWWTKDVVSAMKLEEEADKKALSQIKEGREIIEESKASSADIAIPTPEGLECFPFQKAGIKYAIKRDNVLIGDEMGLGKTIQAIGILNIDTSIKKVLIVCPASLKLNWKKELERWLIRDLSIGVCNGNTPETDILITTYSSLYDREKTTEDEVVLKEGLKGKFDMLIADECHKAKNYKALRTKALFSVTAKKKVFLTGTPVLNRPIELWTTLSNLAPETFSNLKYFMTRYCDGHRTKYGWDVKGASNLGELQEKLRSTIMVRRRKADVLTELPSKLRQVIEIPHSLTEVAAETEAWEQHRDKIEALRAEIVLSEASEDEEAYKEAIQEIQEGIGQAFKEMAKIRHKIAVAKAPLVIEHLEDLLESESKVVVFAHHKDVIEAIYDRFRGTCVKLTGSMSIKERQKSVDRFQEEEEVNLFIGSIQAAGVGITLTESSTVVFAELDWVPANVTQAEDRCHRIGQKDNVLVQHLVLEGSMDAEIAKNLVAKQDIIDQVMDNKVEREKIDTTVNIPVIPKVKIERVEYKDDIEFTDDEKQDILSMLRQLAGVCDGAREKDGCGFNKFDSKIGKSLASNSSLTNRQAQLGKKLCKKYHRQLEDVVYNSVYTQD